MNDQNNDIQSEAQFLGDFLKQKRLDKNYSLEKLSQKTKISVNILKSLESNDFANLPNPAYVKGFVVNYVKILGISQSEALEKMEFTYLQKTGKPFPTLNHTRKFETSAQSSKSENQADSIHNIITKNENVIDQTKSMLPVIIFALVVAVFIGGYKIISSVVENETKSTKSNVNEPTFESSAALDPEVIHQRKDIVETTPETKVEEKKEEPKVVETEKKEEPITVSKPVEERRNFPEVKFNKIRSSLFTLLPESPDNTDTTIFPQAAKDAYNPTMQNIYIKAQDGNTWVSYKIDNQPIESVIIKKDSDLFLQGSEIRLFLGNVNVTRIFYNNTRIDAPTKSGVKSLIFPAESAPKYVLPLFPKANDDILYTSEEYQKRMKLEEEQLQKRNNP